MAEFESLFLSTWDDFPWNGPTCKYTKYVWFDDIIETF